MQISLRKARSAEAAELSNLAMRSKAFWGYSAEFMAACAAELTWDADDIDDPAFSFVVAESTATIVGFYATRRLSDTDYELEALFVDPEHIGSGVGRALIQHAVDALQQEQAATLSVLGDPHAEAFYVAAGARKVGMQASGSIPGRELPLFEIALNGRKLGVHGQEQL